MVIPIIEELRESLRSTRVHFTTIDAPRGVKILEDIIAGFDKRFGNGSHITELREGHDRQPCGYTQVRYVCFVFQGFSSPTKIAQPYWVSGQTSTKSRICSLEEMTHA